MLLQDLFDRLALGELSQHKFGKTGSILEPDYPAIINQINTALTSVYSYFPIREKELIIQQMAQVTEYRLHSDHAQSNTGSTEEYKYLMDTENTPFQDDILRIESAFNEVGAEIPLNDEHDDTSWFTSAWDTLQIPYPVATNITLLVYRAKHVHLSKDAALTTVIDLPPCLEEALQAYIASRCFVSLGNQTSASLATYYSNRYQEQIKHVEDHNLLQSGDSDSNIKLSIKGFN